MAITINEAWQNAFAQFYADAHDTGTNAVRIYGGTAPANAKVALSGQPLLADVSIPEPGFGTAGTTTPGLVTNAGTWEDLSIDNTGTASFYRSVLEDGRVEQGTISEAGGGGDLIVDSVNFVQGGTFTITSKTMQQPDGT